MIPLGPDPKSGLEEFLHYESHEAGASLPERNSESRFEVIEETGIVLVLLPGGSFRMGSQSYDTALPNYDSAGGPDEGPVHEVVLDPCFIGKYEVTQAQWRRFTGDILANWNPEFRPNAITWTHPVEQVDWNSADRFARQLGLLLPTEAQWEYACRAGSSTPYFCGKTLSPTVGNIRDEAYSRTFKNATNFERGFDDEFGYHSPVGSFAPNNFGLFDTQGNVWEWCRDWFGEYTAENFEPGTGLHRVKGTRGRAFRGGAFNGSAGMARSAYRYRNAAESRSNSLSLRVSRQVHD